MAYTLKAPWFAAFIQTLTAGVCQAQRELLAQNLELVHRLGGGGNSPRVRFVEGVLRLAQQRNATQSSSANRCRKAL